MTLLTCVFLRNLQFDSFIRLSEPAEQRRDRLAHLEIDRSVLDLDDDVVPKFPIQRIEDVVSRLGAIVLEIAPIQMMVVNERTIEEHASVRFESQCDCICGVGRRPSITRRTEPPLRVRLHNKTAQVGDLLIDVLGFVLPPGCNPRIQRIERLQSTNTFRSAKLYRDRKPHAPGTKRIGDPGQLRNEVTGENARISIYVVDSTSVDSNRCEQPGILTRPRQIRAHTSVLEKNRCAGISTLNRAIEIVPLVDPA